VKKLLWKTRKLSEQNHEKLMKLTISELKFEKLLIAAKESRMMTAQTLHSQLQKLNVEVTSSYLLQFLLDTYG
jgi:hypothetical protein